MLPPPPEVDLMHPGDGAHPAASAGPAVGWLAVGLLLAGLGTVMLGPVLPDVAGRWHLTDAQSGLLFQAKFVGSFLGGISVPRRLRFGILAGMVLGCVGFASFGLATGLLSGCLTLFVSGLGLGQIIASTNILAGQRYPQSTGAALSTLNFFFSVGAILTGVIAAIALPRFGLQRPLQVFGAMFLLTGLGGLLMPVSRSAPERAGPSEPRPATRNVAAALLVAFALCLFLYGGLETCMTGWLTTFTLRFSNTRLLGGQSALVLLWIALTGGRLLTSVLLRWMREATLLRASLAASAALIVCLAASSNGAVLSALCLLLGLALAPVFPTTFALVLRHKPSPRVAGFVIAVSGLGAALFPWLMGLLSTGSGSLRYAMIVPFLLAVALFALTVPIVRPSVSG